MLHLLSTTFWIKLLFAVTLCARGFFFILVLFCGDSERGSRDCERTFVHDRGFAAHCGEKTKQKKPSGTQGNLQLTERYDFV